MQSCYYYIEEPGQLLALEVPRNRRELLVRSTTFGIPKSSIDTPSGRKVKNYPRDMHDTTIKVILRKQDVIVRIAQFSLLTSHDNLCLTATLSPLLYCCVHTRNSMMKGVEERHFVYEKSTTLLHLTTMRKCENTLILQHTGMNITLK